MIKTLILAGSRTKRASSLAQNLSNSYDVLVVEIFTRSSKCNSH